MNPAIFQQVEATLAPERLDAYRQDGAVPATMLARYLLNMALCETLYSPLQFAEVALRNALHTCLSARLGTATWYEIVPSLPAWQQKQLGEARQKLQTHGKPILSRWPERWSLPFRPKGAKCDSPGQRPGN